MGPEDWQHGYTKSLGVFLNGDAIPGRGPHGEEIVDASFCILFNAHHEPVPFRLPVQPEWGGRWVKVLDTAGAGFEDQDETVEAGGILEVEGRAVVVLQRSG